MKILLTNSLGATDLIMSTDSGTNNATPGTLSALQRKYFFPKDLENATPEEIFTWWQKRGQQEKILKSAIISSEVCLCSVSTTFSLCVLSS